LHSNVYTFYDSQLCRSIAAFSSNNCEWHADPQMATHTLPLRQAFRVPMAIADLNSIYSLAHILLCLEPLG